MRDDETDTNDDIVRADGRTVNPLDVVVGLDALHPHAIREQAQRLAADARLDMEARRERDNALTPPNELRREGGVDLGLFHRALASRWAIPNDVRARVVQRCADIIDRDDVGSRDWIAAARILVACDAVDARREATDGATRRSEVAGATAALRAALASPGARAALAALSDATCAKPVVPTTSAPPAQDDAANV